MARSKIQTEVLKPAKPPSNKDHRPTGVTAEFLLDVFDQVAHGKNLDERLATIVEIASKALNVERSSIFLEDSGTGELYSRVAQGNLTQEIRILNNTGVAGYVFTTGKGLFIQDAYADTRFDPAVDKRTGFTTKSILCTPIKTATGATLGVAQAMNRKKGVFDNDDLLLLSAMTNQVSVFIQSDLFVEKNGEIKG